MKDLLNKFAHDRNTIDPAMFKMDMKAYIQPLYSSIKEADEVAEKLTATYFQGKKLENIPQSSNEIIIEMLESNKDLKVIENFMDLIHEAHI